MMLGIDLGTTNSSCAFYDGKEAVLIPNERGSRTTPSVVAAGEDGEILVGEAARNQAVVHPDRTVRNAKRLMGTSAALPFGSLTVKPEEAASFILAKLKADAEAFLGAEAREAVVTVPAYFSEAQRRATREAGRLAGLEVRRLLNEPTAAAVAWAWSANRTFGSDGAERRVLVYDLGGGTFDATVLAMKGGECRVLAAAGDNRLGGVDFDALLFREAAAALGASPGSGLGPGAFEEDPFLRQQLGDLVERAKIDLSAREAATVALPFAGASRGAHPSWKVTRAEFEALIAPAVDRTIALTAQALAEAKVDRADVDRVVLSGGSSRIPLVRRSLSAFLGRDFEARVNPEEVVALGAAIFAGLPLEEAGGFSVRDAVSRSFGVEIDGDLFVPVIKKNTPIPVSRSRPFTTVADDQATVEIHVLQGESGRASENLSLGRFLLSGIRPGPKGAPRIDVEFSIDADEILHVGARDLDTGAAQDVTIATGLEGAPPASPARMASLAARARALAPAAGADRDLQAELEQALARAGAPAAAAEDALVLEALVAELEARSKDARGGR